MRKRTIAALLACTMVLGTITGCSSEPKNPEDSDTEAVQVSTEAATTTSAGPKIFNDYMTSDVDTLNSHIYTLSVSSDIISPSITPSIPPLSDGRRKKFRLCPGACRK